MKLTPALSPGGELGGPPARQPTLAPDAHHSLTAPPGRARIAEPGAARAEVVPLVADFDSFYRAQRNRIAQALALALGDIDLAGDATDEAMTRAFERWTTVATLDRPEAWVYRVASNWAMSVFRRRRLSLHRLYDPAIVDAAAIGDPAVHAVVAALDIKHRNVVVCRFLLGWSVAETAEALGINEGTVKSRLHRATQTLRTQLRDLHDPEDPS